MTLSRLETELYVDMVAFNRHAELLPDVLAVGCYQLDEDSATRNGSLLICDVGSDGQISPTPRLSWELPGVLHAAWLDEHTMAMALADGRLHMGGFEGLEPGGQVSVSVDHAVRVVDDDGTLALWVDLGRDADDASGSRAVCSCSDGSLALVDCHACTRVQSWAAHELEAWVAVFAVGGGTVYSGADDAIMRCWDPRNDPSQGPVWSTARYDTLACSQICV